MDRMGNATRAPGEMSASPDFPRLTRENHRQTSPESKKYNCIAWSAEDIEHWWQPGKYWPIEAQSDDFSIGVLAQLFKTLGYIDCAMDFSLEPGFQKVALFGDSVYYTHAARQLSDGRWTSKLGKAEDIEHDSPQDVGGGVYGELFQVMK